MRNGERKYMVGKRTGKMKGGEMLRKGCICIER
jgi:hypothetical protein